MYEKNIDDILGFLNEYEHLRGYLGSNKVLRKDIKSIIIRKNNIKITLIDGKLCSFSNKKFKRNVKKDFDKILTNQNKILIELIFVSEKSPTSISRG